MRQQHTDIPWGPIITPELLEGYKGFCGRQKKRLANMGTQRRVKIHTHGSIVALVAQGNEGTNHLLEVRDGAK